MYNITPIINHYQKRDNYNFYQQLFHKWEYQNKYNNDKRGNNYRCKHLYVLCFVIVQKAFELCKKSAKEGYLKGITIYKYDNYNF